MNAMVRQENNKDEKLQKIQEFKDILHRLHEQFYRFCMDTGKNYWLLHTASGFGIRLKKDLHSEFSRYCLEQTINEFALMKMKVRRDERYCENPFYKD